MLMFYGNTNNLFEMQGIQNKLDELVSLVHLNTNKPDLTIIDVNFIGL